MEWRRSWLARTFWGGAGALARMAASRLFPAWNKQNFGIWHGIWQHPTALRQFGVGELFGRKNNLTEPLFAIGVAFQAETQLSTLTFENFLLFLKLYYIFRQWTSKTFISFFFLLTLQGRAGQQAAGADKSECKENANIH